MGTVTFKLDARAAKAVQGFLNVVDAQKKTEGGMRKIARQGKLLNQGMKRLRGTIGNVAGGLVGAQGLRMALSSVITSLKEARDTTIAFEGEITGLLSLGENVKNIDDVKQAVLDMSNAFGVSRAKIADTMFNLESGAAGLSKTIQDEVLKNTLELVKVTGTDMPIAMNALLKTYRIFGSETQTVNDIQNKLFKTAELGFLTFEDLAVLLPDMASAAKTFGFSLDDVGAATITATQKLGKTSKTLTAIRNIFIGMVAVQKKLPFGVKLTKDFSENMKILSELDPKFLLKVFGKRTIAAIGVLTRSSGDLKRNIAELATVTGDVTQEKHIERLKDMSFVYSEMSKSIGEMNKNLALTKGFAGQFGKQDIAFQLRELAAKGRLPSYAQGLATPVAIFSQFISDITGGRTDVGGLGAEGASRRVKALQRTKQFDVLEAERAFLPAGGLTLSEHTSLATSPTTSSDQVLNRIAINTDKSINTVERSSKSVE